MSTELTPQIFASVQPSASTLVVAVQIPPSSNGLVNIYLSTQAGRDQVRVAIKSSQESLSGKNYLLYDTPILEGHPVQIAQVGISGGDQILVWSNLGETAFNISGVKFNEN